MRVEVDSWGYVILSPDGGADKFVLRRIADGVRAAVGHENLEELIIAPIEKKPVVKEPGEPRPPESITDPVGGLSGEEAEKDRAKVLRENGSEMVLQTVCGCQSYVHHDCPPEALPSSYSIPLGISGHRKFTKERYLGDRQWLYRETETIVRDPGNEYAVVKELKWGE